MILTAAAGITILLLMYTFFVRQKDLPPAAVVAPWKHLEARKAAIYENLRDLQFEYRVGKLSDEDYQRTKKELQAELATVLAEIDSVQQNKPVSAVPASVKTKVEPGRVCPHCGARFDKALKFCGECGKAMVQSA